MFYNLRKEEMFIIEVEDEREAPFKPSFLNKTAQHGST